jgi:hypothetical protein
VEAVAVANVHVSLRMAMAFQRVNVCISLLALGDPEEVLAVEIADCVCHFCERLLVR